jgi:hypothetical protein
LGAKKTPELVGQAACELALEYEALTGYPIIEMLDAAGATTVASLEMPAKPVEPKEKTTTEDDALPLT